MKSNRMPKCPSCSDRMIKVYIRNSSQRRVHIGYICRNCNSYNIFKGPVDGKKPFYVGPIFIGLNKIS